MIKAWNERTWKEQKIWYFKNRFKRYADYYEFGKFMDDRKLFCNMYKMVVEALESLPDEPHVVVAVAMNNKIDEYADTMIDIIRKFS